MDYALMKAAHNITKSQLQKEKSIIADAPLSACSSLSRRRAANSQLRQCAADKGLISLVYYLHNVEQLIAWCSINLLLFSSLLWREGPFFSLSRLKEPRWGKRRAALCYVLCCCVSMRGKHTVLHVVCVLCPGLKLSCSNQPLKICQLICLSRAASDMPDKKRHGLEGNKFEIIICQTNSEFTHVPLDQF